MEEVSIIGLDLAKNVFQAHGAAANGAVVLPDPRPFGSSANTDDQRAAGTSG